VKDYTTWLQRAYDRVSNYKPRADIDYTTVPIGARVVNRFSNQASFSECLIRRVGYAAHASVKRLAAVRYSHLSEERARWMESAWLKGVTWAPILVEAVVEDGLWVVNSIENYDVSLFLQGRQQMLVLQIVEPGHLSGSNGKLRLLRKGLHFRDGKHCPVVLERIVL